MRWKEKLIVEEVKIEKAGSVEDQRGECSEEYYKIMIQVFDRWWEWEPEITKPRLTLQEAMKVHEELRRVIHAS